MGTTTHGTILIMAMVGIDLFMVIITILTDHIITMIITAQTDIT